MSIMAVLWQLCDSGFPSGGFAHSGGLEAAVQGGMVQDEPSLIAWVRWSLANGLSAGAGYLNLACADPGRLVELDTHCHTTVLGHVSRRASTAQGQGMLQAAAAAWPQACRPLKQAARAAESPGHLAPVFGAVCGAIGIAADECRRAFAWTSVRDQVSAAIRLNLIGPLRAQHLLASQAADAAAQADHHAGDDLDAVRCVGPVVELITNTHDAAYARLFRS